jgi:hypothetical protein
MDVDSNHRGSAAGSDSIFQRTPDPWNYPPSPRFVFRENWERVEHQLGARLDKVESNLELQKSTMYQQKTVLEQWHRQLEELATQVQRAMADMAQQKTMLEQQHRQLEELALEQQKAAEIAHSSASGSDTSSFNVVKSEQTESIEELKTTLTELVSRMQALETKKDTVT